MKNPLTSKLFKLFSNKALCLSALFAFGAGNALATTTNYTAAGNATWLCPAGVSQVQVEAWGGGGAGGGDSASPNYVAVGGGAGGSYVKYTVSVTPGNTYNLTVGAGGVGAATGATGVSGGASIFGGTTAGSTNGALVVAVGGPGGVGNTGATAGANTARTGGILGGVGTTFGNIPGASATVNTAGANGGTSVGGAIGTAHSGAGGAGAGPGGGAGGPAAFPTAATTIGGTNGVAPGGGGSGAANATASKAGGNGGAGQLTLTYVAAIASAANSTVAASPTSIAADNTTTSTITVTLLDASSNPVSGKTVTLSSSRGATDTISAASGASSASGVVTFTVKSSTTGTAIFTAVDSSDSVTVTQTASVSFTGLAVDHFTVTPSSGSVAAGQPFTATVQAYNASNVAITDSSADGTIVTMTANGSIQFDANNDAIFGDNTKALTNGTFTIYLRDLKAESSTITATAGTAVGTSSSVSITPGTAVALQLLLPGETATPGVSPGKTGSPSARTSGAGFSVVVNEVDANYNVVSSTDTVQLTGSGDANVVLPANTALVAGSATLSVTNIIAGGGRTLTATDVTSGGITANVSPSYAVLPGAVTQLVLIAPGESATFGAAPGKTGSATGQSSTVGYSVTVDALDANYNLVTNSTDTIAITSSDVAATLPVNTALVGGTKTLSLTNNTVATVTLTATNVTQGTAVAVGTSSVVVSINTTTTALASSANPASAGQSILFTATIGGTGVHTGTVTFKSGSTVLGTSTVSGSKATFTTSGGAGTYSITAAYSGDSNSTASTSSALSQVIQSGGLVVNPAAMEDGQDWIQSGGYTNNVPPGARGPWLATSSTTTAVSILTNDLTGATTPDIKSIPNVNNPGTSHLRLNLSGAAARDYYRPIGTVYSNGAVYFSMVMGVTSNAQSDQFIFTMLASTNVPATASTPNTNDPLSLHERVGLDSLHYNLGVQMLGGTTAWATNEMLGTAAFTNYLVVLKYDFSGTASLYINPTPGAAEPSPSAVATAGAATAPSDIGIIMFSESGSTRGTNHYDTFRVDSNWYNATPAEGSSGVGLASISFATAPQVFLANANSSLMTVNLLDQTNGLFTATANTVISLSSSSSGGQFISAADGTTVITNVTVATGTNSASFYYRDNITGFPVLTASSGLLAPGTQTENISLPPGLVDHFTVTPSTFSVSAGSVFTATVQAYDTNNSPITSSILDGNIVTLTSSGLAQFDANGDATYGDNTKTIVNGAFTINVRDLKAETLTLSAALGLYSGTSSAVTITPNVAAKLQLLLPGETAAPGTVSGKTGTPAVQAAGAPFNIVVNEVDANWNKVSSTDTVSISGTGDANIVLPANTALVAGTATLSVTDALVGAGYTLTASDVTSGSITSSTSASYNVVAGAVAHLVLLAPGETATVNSAPGKTGTPAHQLQGVPFTVTAVAFDAYYNQVISSSDTVGITSTDARASLPSNAALSGGSKGFIISQNTGGTVTDTATDLTTVAATTGSTTITIDPVPAYKSVQSGNWEDINTWQISYDGTTWSPATNAPTALNADSIYVTNGFNVTVTANEVIDQTTVSSNSVLTIATGVAVTATNGFGNDLDVSGKVDNLGSLSATTGASIVFEAGSTYQHDQDGGAIVTATWDPASTCEIIGWKVATSVSATTALKQKFGNFTWNSTNQTSTLSFGSSSPTNFSGNFNVKSTGSGILAICLGATVNLQIGGDLNVSGGTLYGATTGSGTETLNIAGNINITGGAVNLNANVAGTEVVVWNVGGDVNVTGGSLSGTDASNPPALNFVKSGTQKIVVSGSGSINPASTIAWGVTSNSTLDLGTTVINGVGAFTNAPGSGLITANAGGLTGSIALPSTNIVLSSAASYTYNGAVAQSGETLLPATVAALTINNSHGVTLPNSVTAASLTLVGSPLSGTVVANGNLYVVGSGSTISGGTVDLTGATVNYQVIGSPLTQGAHLVVGSAGGAVVGTPNSVAVLTGAGSNPSSLLESVSIVGGSLYLNSTELLALQDSALGFFSGQNAWFTNATGLSFHIWSSTNSSLSISNWFDEGAMDTQVLGGGLTRYSFNFNPVFSPTYYIAGVANVGPYTLSPVPAAILTTTNFTDDYAFVFTNVSISATGVLGLVSAPPAAPVLAGTSGVYGGTSFQFQFSGTSGLGYTVRASTNLTSWTVIGTGTFGGSAVHFTDTNASLFPNRFYRVSIP